MVGRKEIRVSTTRIGFVGVGQMGQCAHLKNCVTVPDCEVVAVADLRGTGRLDIVAPEKNGLYVLFNGGV